MRFLLVLLVASVSAFPAAAQERPAPRGAAAAFWFDPTQLPAFTGTVERYLVNPRGETDALLFREGPQIVFPPEFGEAVRQAAAPGRPIIVWGIRARQAPVITMLAFAPDAEASPVVVERFYWRLSGDGPAEQAERLAVSGTVRAPYFTPQGEVAGAVLEDGTVVSIRPHAAAELRDLLRANARIAAEGRGVAGPNGRALVAERIGADAGSLRDLPQPAAPDPQPQRR
jgi:hypothetical protein